MAAINRNRNIRYELTNRDPFEADNVFTKKITKEKKRIFDAFAQYILSYCRGIVGTEHDNYYAFANTVHLKLAEFNWFWISDKSADPKSLLLRMRPTPSAKATLHEYNLSANTLNDVIDSVISCLKESAARYQLVFDEHIARPKLKEEKPVPSKVKQSIDEDILFSDYIDFKESIVYANCNNDAALDAALSVSESSPYRYAGDTRFVPISAKSLAAASKYFSFSFSKWKVMAWTINKQTPKFVQNVLLVSKESRSIWVIVSISKRKVLCVSKNPFTVQTKSQLFTSQQLLSLVFGEEQDEPKFAINGVKYDIWKGN